MRHFIHSKAGRVSIFLGYFLLSVVTIFPLTSSKAPGTIYLYFSVDDVPGDGCRAIDSIARLDSIKMNVFIIGKFVFKNDTAQQLFRLLLDNPLIEAGNHSFSHANDRYRLYYSNPAEVITDFDRNEDTLQLKNKIARLPGRNNWRIKSRSYNDLPDAKPAADSLAARGYTVYGWDIEWSGMPGTTDSIQTAAVILAHIDKLTRGNALFTSRNIVILCHDAMFRNRQAVEELQSFIRQVKERGYYHFEHLSRYPHP